jgi:hypothetical protein
MARQSIGGGSGGSKSWADGDKFTAIVTMRSEKIQGDDAEILTFVTEKGEIVERWATTAWLRMFHGEPADKKAGRPAQKAVLKDGDVVSVAAQKETKTKKGGNRFRPFSVELLTGKDIPKGLR